MRRILLALLCVLTQAAFLPAKDAKWFEISSDHFLLFTDTNEIKGRRLVSDFENRIATFSQAFGKVPTRQFPIEIFLFNEEQDFIEAIPRVQTAQPSQPQRGVQPQQGTPAQNDKLLSRAAHLLRGPDRIFVVARDKSPDDIANDVAHALGHALIERYTIFRSFWLSEGAAEYLRKIGRSADSKVIAEEDAFSAADMLTIVPSATYNDNDPPTPFRLEAYRFLRFMLDQKADVLKEYLKTLRSAEWDKLPKAPIDGAAIEQDFKKYVETPIKAAPVTAAIKSGEADMARLAIHRGDVLVAADRPTEAVKWYNADSKDARAARAVLTRYTRPSPEAIRALDRAAREIPESGLVQYHFGAMEIQEPKDIQSQVAALERAVQVLPLMGRAFAELARVYAASGQADKSLPLVSKALDLEPEYADRIYEIRAEVYAALGESAKALHDINLAADLPHADRSAIEHFNVKILYMRKRVEAARREVDSRDLEALRTELRAEADRREPPPKPAPPPPPVPPGTISYEIETRAPIDVVNSVYPDYAESLRSKGVAGTITVQVDIGPDGTVKTASIANSQVTDLNKATLDAVKKWTFKPGNRSIRLLLKFALQ
jgi:TonB family protein